MIRRCMRYAKTNDSQHNSCNTYDRVIQVSLMLVLGHCSAVVFSFADWVHGACPAAVLMDFQALLQMCLEGKRAFCIWLFMSVVAMK